MCIHPGGGKKQFETLGKIIECPAGTLVEADDDYFVGRSLDVFISRLRKYMKEDENVRIENLHGVGFKLTDEPIAVEK